MVWICSKLLSAEDGHTVSANRLKGWSAPLKAALVLIAVVIAPAAYADEEVVLGFDLYNDLATNITVQGVTFAGATVLACGASLNCQGFPPASGRNVIYDSSNGTITATLDNRVTGKVSSVSARITGNTNITMTAYDDVGAVIASKSTGGANYVGSGSSIGPNLKLTITSTSDRSIAKVTFNDSGNTFTVDDFAYVGRATAFVFDPGHGIVLGKDGLRHYQRPPSPTFGLREDNLTLAIGLAAKAQLIADGYANVYVTRATDEAIYKKACDEPVLADNTIAKCNADLKLRIKLVTSLELDENKRTIFVSIHTNGGDGRGLYGRTQTFWCEKRSQLLATKLQAAIEALVPPNFHPFGSVQKECADLAVLDKTAAAKIPGALVEVLYHNNVDDETLLNSVANLTAYGKAIASAGKAYAEEQ